MVADVTANVAPSARRTTANHQQGLSISRLFTKPGVDPLSQIEWEIRRSEIKSPDGKKMIFEMPEAEVPKGWSPTALDIAADKYFRKAGVPTPSGKETSVRMMVNRVAKAIRSSGERQGGYFATEADADAFENELRYMLANQFGAFNSPVWFNVGLAEAYGITGKSSENFVWDRETNTIKTAADSYSRPAGSACFIVSVEDDLLDIARHVEREMRIFRFGGGSGGNYSRLRAEGESLSNGGVSSGLMSFLKVFDVSAGAIKSGGTCLAPTQRVYTHRGPVAVKELAEKGEDFVVLSYDPPAGRYKAKTARAWCAGRKKVMKIVTDKGEFDLTYDHPVKLSSEETVRVENLKPGMSLFACAVDIGNNGPYLRVGLRDGAKGRMRFNRLIAKDVMGLEVEGYSIHHKDENTFNNHPTNLERKLQADHARDHNNEYVEAGTHVFQENDFPHDGENNGMHSSSEFWRDEGKVEVYKTKQGEILKESGRAAVMQREAGTQRMLNLGYRIINAGYEIDTFEKYWEARKLAIGPIGTPKAEMMAAFEARFGSYDGFVKELLVNNHRVVSVSEIGEMDVYDVEVDCPTPDDKSPESGHNFVIWSDAEFTGSGVVVFNTRRAAKLVCLDADHPDIEKFVDWKVKEEEKALALINAGYSRDFNGDAYQTVSGQNANNSVRLTDEFMQAVLADKPWETKWRTTGKVAATLSAKKLFRKIADAAHRCADPGLMFDTTINRWNPVINTGRIEAANPCQPAWATVLTPEGVRTFGDIDVGSTIWSGLRWTKVSNKVATGVKPVYAYRTQGGTFFGTENHRVVQGGKKIEVKDAVCIDSCARPGTSSSVKSHEVFAREYMGECPVYDITVEASEHTYWTDGLLVSNCNEFHFLQNTACNLSSLNIMKFMAKKDGAWHFDVQAFRHAARIFTLAKEIIVDYASYPTREIAQNSHDYRPLGLGYANLGASLMIQSVPYDSPDGCAFAAAVNSVLCGVAYETSSEIAASKGPFPGFAHNREPMLKVIGMHRAAAHDVRTERYAGIVAEGRRAWDSAAALADKHGVRNGQVTVTAPTGTIGLMMDCDTTGIEPDFSLVKAKKLAGGGYLKIVNRSVDAALEALGYTTEQRAAAVQHVLDHGTLEGWKDMKPEHLPVFDCANRCGDGKRFIEPMGHIRMLAAVQPFVSGSISKTVNCPKETTVEEVEGLYMEAWKRGLKCIAIYRDKSKHAQVLDSGDTKKDTEAKAEANKAAEGSKSDIAVTPPEDAVVTLPRVVVRDDRSSHGPPRTQRHRLPKKRPGGLLQELTVGGQKLYLRTGEYADGSVGELFIDMHKDGSTMRSMTNMFAIAVSLGLQHGVPIQEYVDAFTFMKFDPAGPVDHPNVKMSTSVVDAVFRVLAFEYMGDDGLEYVQKKPTDEEISEMRGRRALLLAANDARAAISKSAQPAKPAVPVANSNGNGTYGKNGTGAYKRSMVEAQTCSRCGNLTVRTGTCSTCTACGLSSGCA